MDSDTLCEDYEDEHMETNRSTEHVTDLASSSIPEQQPYEKSFPPDSKIEPHENNWLNRDYENNLEQLDNCKIDPVKSNDTREINAIDQTQGLSEGNQSDVDSIARKQNKVSLELKQPEKIFSPRVSFKGCKTKEPSFPFGRHQKSNSHPNTMLMARNPTPTSSKPATKFDRSSDQSDLYFKK